MKLNHQRTPAQQRVLRVRKKIFGTAERPRVTVFRSNEHLYIQVIDDVAGKTIAAVNDVQKGAQKSLSKKSKTEKAVVIAEEIAKKLKSAKVSRVVFDRGAYNYHGRVKAVAETLRKQGIQV